MAIAEQEITRPLSIALNQAQRKKLEAAAFAAGQTVPDFAASALIRAADTALTQIPDPLDKVIGIFRDEPLMDALMERVREDRRVEMEAERMEAERMEAKTSG